MGSIAQERSSKIEDGDILISELEDLSFDEIQEEDSSSINGKAYFDMGEISHPKFGKACIRGTLPLLLPEGVFQLHSEESKKRAYDFIVNWLEERNFDFEEQDPFIRLAIDSFTATSPPTIPVDAPLSISILASIIIGFYVDDVYESSYLSQLSSGGSADSKSCEYIIKPLNDTVLGKYKSLKELPNFDFPLLQPIIWLAYMANEQGVKGRPDFVECATPCLKTQIHALESGLIVADAEFMAKCSDEVYLEVREIDGATRSLLEIWNILNYVTLSKKVRSNLIYKSLRATFGRIVTIANDMFGIEKEMELEAPMNLVLRRLGKLSLQESVDQTISRLAQDIKYFNDCSEKLIQMFPEDQNVASFVNIVKYAIDGSLYLYTISPRYGKPKIDFRYD